MVHALKIKPLYFNLINAERKLFEVRKKDRSYAIDDYLALNEYDDLKEIYTGASLLVKITSILDDERYCKEGYVILGIKKIQIKDGDFETYGGMIVSSERKAEKTATEKVDGWIRTTDRLPIKEYYEWCKVHGDNDFEVIVQIQKGLDATVLFFAVNEGEYLFYSYDYNNEMYYYDPIYWQPMPEVRKDAEE